MYAVNFTSRDDCSACVTGEITKHVGPHFPFCRPRFENRPKDHKVKWRRREGADLHLQVIVPQRCSDLNLMILGWPDAHLQTDTHRSGGEPESERTSGLLYSNHAFYHNHNHTFRRRGTMPYPDGITYKPCTCMVACFEACEVRRVRVVLL